MTDATHTIKIVVDRSQADRDISTLNNELNGIGKNAKGFDDVRSGAERMGDALKQAGVAADAATVSHKKLTASLGNTRLGMMEFQHITRGVTDGLASGASPMQVFTMHIGMLGEAVAMSGSKFGKLGEFLGGGWGLALTAAISVGAMLINNLKGQSDAVGDALDKLHKHTAEAQADAEAQKMFAGTLDGVEQVILNLNKAMQDYNNGLKSQAELEEQAAKTALDEVDALKQKAIQLRNIAQGQLLVAMSDPNRGTNLGTAAEQRESHLQDRVNYFDDSIKDADTKTKILRDHLDQWHSIVVMQHAAEDATQKINDKYKVLEDNARKIALAHHESDAALTKEITLLEKKKQIELDAAEAAKRHTNDNQFGKKVDFSDAEQIAQAAGLHVTSGYRQQFGHGTPGHLTQEDIYNDPHYNHPGNPVAKPGTSAHGGVNGKWALDIAFAPGLDPAKLRKIYGDEGVSLTAVYKESGHYHIEGQRDPNAVAADRSAENDAKDLANSNKRYDDLLNTTKQLGQEDNVRAKLMDDIKDKVTSIYTKSDGTLKISKEELESHIKTAQALEDQAIAADASKVINKKNVDYADTELKLRAKLAGVLAGTNADDTAAAQKAADEAKINADLEAYSNQLKAKGLVEQSGQYKLAMAEADAHERTNIALEHQIAMMGQLDADYKEALQYAEQRGDAGAGQALATFQFQEDMKKVNQDQAAVYTLTGAQRAQKQAEVDFETKVFKEKYGDANEKIATDFYNRFTTIADDLQKIFKGQFGQVLAGLVKGIGGIVSQLRDANGKSVYNPNGTPSPVGDLFHQLSGVSNNIASAFGPDGSLTKLFGTSAPGSFFSKLSDTLGQAAGGAQTGAAIGQIGSAIAPKHFSSTGAQIGGAIGSFIPIPGGDIIGSVIGGIIGGLFKKNVNPKGTSTVSVDQLTGQFTASAASGTSDAAKQNAQDFANTVSSTVNQIAQQLGGQIVGTFSEALKVSGKNGKDFFVDGQIYHDPNQAAFVAEQKALLATLQGVSDFTMRILKAANSTNFNSIVQVASNYEGVLKELQNLSNPMADQIKTVVQQTDQLTKAMTSLGATTDELANVTQFRELKLKQILDDNLSSLKDFQKSLSGQGSGIPDIQRLATDITQFKAMEADKLAGKTVDQNAFTQLGQEIFQLAGQIYGTSTDQFQQIRSMLMDATQGMIDAVTNDYNQAIIDATNATTAAVNVSNNYLGQIVGILNNGGGVGGAAGGGGGATGGGGGSNGSYDYSGYGGGSGTRPGTSGLSAPRLANY